MVVWKFQVKGRRLCKLHSASENEKSASFAHVACSTFQTVRAKGHDFRNLPFVTSQRVNFNETERQFWQEPLNGGLNVPYYRRSVEFFWGIINRATLLHGRPRRKMEILKSAYYMGRFNVVPIE